jgi:hypothetical protein
MPRERLARVEAACSFLSIALWPARIVARVVSVLVGLP